MQPFDKERAKMVKKRLELLEEAPAAQGSPWMRAVLQNLKEDLEPFLYPELPDWLTINDKDFTPGLFVLDSHGDSISLTFCPASKTLGLHVVHNDGLIEFNPENAKRVEIFAEAMLAWSRGSEAAFGEYIGKLKSEGV
jgi:hypothetical protein